MRVLTGIYDAGTVFCFCVMMGCVLIEVCTRNILHIPTTWAEELSRFMFVWTVFLGSASAWARKTHIAIHILPGKVKGKAKAVLFIVSKTLTLLFLVAVWIGSVAIMFEQYEAKTTALEISIAWFYLGVFLGATGMVMFQIVEFIRFFKSPETPAKPAH